MRATVLLAAVLLLSPPAARAGDDPAPPAPAAAPAGKALLYLGLNDRGAEEWLRVKDGAVAIRVPGGPYRRRAYEGRVATGEPQPFEVRSFLVDKFEVTNARFARFLNESGADPARLLRREVPGLVREDERWAAAPGLEQHPVTAATGFGAVEYARWAGARLPSQPEWEKAAGGPEGRLYPWGDAKPDATLANFGRPAPRGTEPVGSHPLGASPCGCMDMAGNVYDRVETVVGGRDSGERIPVTRPVMLKGGSWLSPHPLNLRVLDLCMQPMEVADRSVGFRCATDDPEPDRPTRAAEPREVLRLAGDFDAAVKEARERRVPIFLSLLHDTCGQCDRTREQCYRDPRFIAYCNANLLVVVGHQPWDADDDPHPARPDGTCPLYPGLTCRQHERLYPRGLEVVGRFMTSPGNFVLHPDRCRKGAGKDAVLVPERDLPKWGDAVDAYLAAFERARSAMAAEAGGPK